jgi:hypothetical protein
MRVLWLLVVVVVVFGTVARCCNLHYVRSIVGYNKRKENPCGSTERAAGNNPALRCDASADVV